MDPKKTLKESALFHDFNSLELIKVSEIARACFLAEGESVISEGEDFGMDTSLYLIVSGLVKVVVPMSDGRELVLAILQPPSHFGEMSFVDDRPRTANVVALEDTHLLRFDHDALGSLLSEDLSTSVKFYRGLSKSLVKKIRAVNERLMQGMHASGHL